MSLSQAKYVLDTIGLLLDVKPEYDSEDSAHKVLTELYPVDDWVKKLEDVFALHLSAQMVLNNLQNFEGEFLISHNLFNQIVHASPRAPLFKLDDDLMINLLASIVPFIQEMMKASSTDVFHLSVMPCSIVDRTNLSIKYSLNRKSI